MCLHIKTDLLSFVLTEKMSTVYNKSDFCLCITDVVTPDPKSTNITNYSEITFYYHTIHIF